jgi:hypothetical protein
MSETLAAADNPPDAAPELLTEHVCQAPVVITEQSLAFSTAAAVPLPRPKTIHRVTAVLRAMFLSRSEHAPSVPHHYPPRRDEFLERAAMAREMYRL